MADRFPPLLIGNPCNDGAHYGDEFGNVPTESSDCTEMAKCLSRVWYPPINYVGLSWFAVSKAGPQMDFANSQQLRPA